MVGLQELVFGERTFLPCKSSAIESAASGWNGSSVGTSRSACRAGRRAGSRPSCRRIARETARPRTAEIIANLEPGRRTGTELGSFIGRSRFLRRLAAALGRGEPPGGGAGFDAAWGRELRSARSFGWLRLTGRLTRGTRRNAQEPRP